MATPKRYLYLIKDPEDAGSGHWCYFSAEEASQWLIDENEDPQNPYYKVTRFEIVEEVEVRFETVVTTQAVKR